MSGPEAKGTNLVNLREWTLANHGEAGLAKVLGRLVDPADRAALESPIAFSWYPTRTTSSVLQALCDEFFGGATEGARVLGAYDADRQVNRVYRFFLARMSLESLMVRVPRLLAQSFRGIDFSVRVHHPKHIDLVIAGHAPAAVDCEDWLGTLQTTASFCYCDRPRVTHPRCVRTGAQACTFSIESD